MSFQRKNARRLKKFRRGGIMIDANYRVTAETVRRLELGWLRKPGIPETLQPRMVDPAGLVYHLHPHLQRVIVGGLEEAEGRRLA